MGQMEEFVRLTGISKSFTAVRALQDADIQLHKGEVVGLVGENGAGKSTLIGVLTGRLTPDQGEYLLKGHPAPVGNPHRLSQLGISVVTQEQTLVEPMRVYENLLLGHEDQFMKGRFINHARMRAEARSLLDEMGIGSVAVDAVVAHLGFPKRQMVEIARAFAISRLTDNEPIILLDEPTSALTESDAELLFAKMGEWRDRVAFLFVSHQLPDVLRVSDRVVVMKDGCVVKSIENKNLCEADLHALMVGRARSSDYYHIQEQAEVYSDRPIIELRSATSQLNSIGQHSFVDINLAVRGGEVLGVAGVVGSGKSEVAAALAGASRLQGGELVLKGATVKSWSVRKAIRAGVVYLPPERAADSIIPTGTIGSNISIGFLDLIANRISRLINAGKEKRRLRVLLEQYQVKPRDPTAPIGELSGGNQQKVMFARWMGRESDVVILDDPTRGIDVGTREEMYGYIRQLLVNRKAVVLVAESLEELIGLSNRILVLKDGRVTAEITAPAGAKPSELDVVKHMV